MDDDIATFLAFTASEDATVAKQFLDLSGGNVEYAVQLYLESGEHPPSQSLNDEQLAEQLQRESYQHNDVREADANVHRHETLLDSFSTFNAPVEHEGAIFGTGRAGIFNQRFQQDDGFSEDQDEDSSNDDMVEVHSDDDVVEVDEDGDPVIHTNRRTRAHSQRLNELSSTQRRLAELFKPPFDLMSRLSLDSAKIKGREEKKWILVNIQDQSEFQCQVLNRDFWSNPAIKEVVKRDFIFLQYQHDSPHGQSYLSFYSVDAYPHVAILDPMTGERVYKWTDGIVCNVHDWIADVELFLEKFSLQPGSQNPLVKHEAKFDPSTMSEDQQIEFALKQSMDAADKDTSEQYTENGNNESTSNPDPFDSIEPKDHVEPATGPSTRIQIRFPNGKRLIHKFNPESDTVLNIFQWLKSTLASVDESQYGIGNEPFSISAAGKPKLIDSISLSIKEAGLSNASILLEKM